MKRNVVSLALVAGSAAVLMTGCETLNMETVTAQIDPSGEYQMTRAQVLAELHEAQRLNLIPVGESDPPQATAAELQQIAAAGERAKQSQTFAAK